MNWNGWLALENLTIPIFFSNSTEEKFKPFLFQEYNRLQPQQSQRNNRQQGQEKDPGKQEEKELSQHQKLQEKQQVEQQQKQQQKQQEKQQEEQQQKQHQEQQQEQQQKQQVQPQQVQQHQKQGKPAQKDQKALLQSQDSNDPNFDSEAFKEVQNCRYIRGYDPPDMRIDPDKAFDFVFGDKKDEEVEVTNKAPDAKDTEMKKQKK